VETLMRVDFYGLAFETPRVTVYLWSPWRAAALEHRLFEVVTDVAGKGVERDADEWRLHITDAKVWRSALNAVCRVLKGWQEEADPHQERRAWRWLLEGDTDDHGYDHAGEPAAVWAYLRLGLDRGGPDEPEKGEDVDLNGFGIRIDPIGKGG
jgi:hypothetical protein